ncbi:MAG: ribosomal-processing cysteine protease Prp [Eubacteriales bacterium]|nr:ribosomal-processing cysteine protease Prp [Eubacteriales bacterium]
MTTVTVQRVGQAVRSISVSGHSHYDESGYDIVCAAASTLITTCANALESVARIRPLIRQGEAELSVQLPAPLSQQQAHDAQIIFQTVIQGFQDVAQEYPHNLQIK